MREPARRILVADDDAAIRRMLVVLFRSLIEGYEFDEATNGHEALRAMHARSYAAAVLDVIMPKTTGLEVVDVLRQEGITTPIILMTGSSQAAGIIGAHSGAVVLVEKGTADFQFTVLEHLLQFTDPELRQRRLLRVRTIADRLFAGQRTPATRDWVGGGAPASSLPQMPPFHFLIVAYDAHLRDDLGRFLELYGFTEASGYTIGEAESRAAALDAIRAIPIVANERGRQLLVIVDLQINGGENALTFAQSLRERFNPPIEVVLFGDAPSPQHITTGHELGVIVVNRLQRDEFLPAAIRHIFRFLRRPLPERFEVEQGFARGR